MPNPNPKSQKSLNLKSSVGLLKSQSNLMPVNDRCLISFQYAQFVPSLGDFTCSYRIIAAY